ncbi:hypothetical protein GCM10008090_06290 [Arenicella chitinivorans]|uniref:Biopolymer transporter ExbD n=1 Tax=Arenicella chitinivorans TaxID=1329800 RepID=A0A918RIE8_9GAMM|nr:biopolymer transporter ExbD [Arenicella chitinivorans]GHA00311.1 hypothetical protein GCM10008090_06290 [Arenicella chitinivorans]
MGLLSARRVSNNDQSLIPLINIVFLLLIFFMIAGQISAFDPRDTVPPASTSKEAVDQTAVSLVLDRQNQLFWDGEAISPQVLSDRAAQFDGDIKLTVDHTMLAKDLDAVLSVFRRHGVASLTLVARSPES